MQRNTHIFVMQGLGALCFFGGGVYFFGVFGTKKWAKNGGASTGLDQKKCFFWWVKWGKNTMGGGVFYTGLGRFLGRKGDFLGRRRRPKNGVMRHFFGWKLPRRFGGNSGRRTRRKGISLSGKAISTRGKERRIVALSHCRTTSPACARFIIYIEI